MAASSSSSSSSCEYLDRISCCDQPLDVSFHPQLDNVMATALVDGTVELHDIRRRRPRGRGGGSSGRNHADEGGEDEEEDEDDSILASLTLCEDRADSAGGSRNSTTVKTAQFTCHGTTIIAATSNGMMCGIDAAERPQTTTDQTPKYLWNVNTYRNGGGGCGGGGASSSHPIVTVHPFGGTSSSCFHSNLFATGDDGGGVRIWDRRLLGDNSDKNKRLPTGCVRYWHEHDDYVSGIDYAPQWDQNVVVTSSADGRLGVWDMRISSTTGTDLINNNGKTHQTYRLSDDQEDELLSVKIVKNGTKVVCGTGLGVLQVFSWGTWGDCSDRFPGHPSSVDTLLKIDESCLLTGSSDGVMRVVQIQPDQLLGVVGSDHNGFPVEKLAFNSNRHVVGSVSHDSHIRLWDARVLLDDSDTDDNDSGDDNDDHDREDEDDRKQPATTSKDDGVTAKSKSKSKPNESDDEWEDMNNEDDADDDDDNDSEDSEDSSSSNSSVGRKGGRKRLKTDNEKFFEDL